MSNTAAKPHPDFYAAARFNMVESQLRPNKVINEKLLDIIGRLPREAFVPADQKSQAYSDNDISVGYGRKMLAPMTLARMIMALNLQDEDRVLDIGPATGYSSAILNDLAGEIIALESDAALTRQLQQNKIDFLLENTRLVQGSLSDGYAAASPYNAIIIEGAAQWIPEKIINQLAEGGRMVCVVYPEGDLHGKIGEARLYTKQAKAIIEQKLFDTAAPLLPGFVTRPKFVF
ncbi:MAG: protein-L-isoaspartate O-methyltransferase [Alphaproteobacteria bacterium]|nr:protein-L-isoaspartate O-methyltransferase [Alphaproteobacteria bacterium]